MSYQNILVGVDGSKQADMAFEKAVDTVKTNDAKLYLLSIINGERYPSTGPGGYGFVSHSIYDVKVGNAKVELAERYPKENDIDLIIIGATGLNVVGRLLVGSTAAYTIREAPCDVTVVKTNLKNQKLDIKETTYPEM